MFRVKALACNVAAKIQAKACTLNLSAFYWDQVFSTAILGVEPQRHDQRFVESGLFIERHQKGQIFVGHRAAKRSAAGARVLFDIDNPQVLIHATHSFPAACRRDALGRRAAVGRDLAGGRRTGSKKGRTPDLPAGLKKGSGGPLPRHRGSEVSCQHS